MVGLNFYPPSSDARTDFWASSTSGGTLMANSLLWSGKVPPLILMGPTNLILSAGAPAAFNVAATGLPPLSYQWRKNGTNIPGATEEFIPVHGADRQQRSLLRGGSNTYGIAVSEIAALNSPVRLLPAGGSPGAVALLLEAADGSPLTAYRASRIYLYSATNAAQPFSTWTLSSNPLFLSNGVVWVQGLTATNTKTFFRASEAP